MDVYRDDNSQTWLVGLGGNLLESEKVKHCCHKLYSIGNRDINIMRGPPTSEGCYTNGLGWVLYQAQLGAG